MNSWNVNKQNQHTNKKVSMWMNEWIHNACNNECGLVASSSRGVRTRMERRGEEESWTVVVIISSKERKTNKALTRAPFPLHWKIEIITEKSLWVPKVVYSVFMKKWYAMNVSLLSEAGWNQRCILSLSVDHSAALNVNFAVSIAPSPASVDEVSCVIIFMVSDVQCISVLKKHTFCFCQLTSNCCGSP